MTRFEKISGEYWNKPGKPHWRTNDVGPVCFAPKCLSLRATYSFAIVEPINGLSWSATNYNNCFTGLAWETGVASVTECLPRQDERGWIRVGWKNLDLLKWVVKCEGRVSTLRKFSPSNPHAQCSSDRWAKSHGIHSWCRTWIEKVSAKLINSLRRQNAGLVTQSIRNE